MRPLTIARRMTDDEEELVMKIASRGATMAVDWEQRIDFAPLRSDRL